MRRMNLKAVSSPVSKGAGAPACGTTMKCNPVELSQFGAHGCEVDRVWKAGGVKVKMAL